MAGGVYYNFIDSFMKGEHDLADDTLRIALLDDTYVPDYTNHTAYSDVSGSEISGTGYSAGGGTLHGQQWRKDDSTDAFMLDAGDIGWAMLREPCRYAALYNDTHSGDELIALFDFGANTTPTGDAFVIEWNSLGLIQVGIATNVYDSLIDYLGRGEVNLNSDTIQAVLLTSLYTFDSTHTSYSDLDNEVTGTGYTAGGETVPANSITLSGNTATFTATNVAWEDLDITSAGARYIALYCISHSSNIMVCIDDLSTDYDPAGDTFVVQINANGILKLNGQT